MQKLSRTTDRAKLLDKSATTLAARRSRRLLSRLNKMGILEMNPGQSVHFEMETEVLVGDSIVSATSALDWLRTNESRLRYEVARDLKNRILLEWNLGTDLDLCKFQESMNLHSIFLRSDLSWELYYEDGDIFGGQIVVGETTSDGSLQKVYLAA